MSPCRHGQEVVFNEAAGHILRTKSSEDNDAGVVKGVTVFDNALIV